MGSKEAQHTGFVRCQKNFHLVVYKKFLHLNSFVFFVEPTLPISCTQHIHWKDSDYQNTLRNIDSLKNSQNVIPYDIPFQIYLTYVQKSMTPSGCYVFFDDHLQILRNILQISHKKYLLLPQIVHIRHERYLYLVLYILYSIPSHIKKFFFMAPGILNCDQRVHLLVSALFEILFKSLKT